MLGFYRISIGRVVFDALRVRIRDEATVRSKAVYLALAARPDGSRDILGIWIEPTEGAKLWMKVFTDLQTRGCQDILIAVTHGLKGMSEATNPLVSKLQTSAKMRARLLAGAPLTVLALAACHRSGTWSDDPKNFERAWGQPAPSGLQIRNSWYWRSAHFTREEAYYFHFVRHIELMRGFISENSTSAGAGRHGLVMNRGSRWGRIPHQALIVRNVDQRNALESRRDQG